MSHMVLQKRIGESDLDAFEARLVTRGKLAWLMEHALVAAALLWYLGLVVASRG